MPVLPVGPVVNMTDNFIAFFYRERLLVAVVSMLIVAGGILALAKLNVDAFPDVTPVQVEIDTDAQGLAGWKNAVEVGIHGDDGSETRIIVKASFTRAKIENRLALLASLEPRIQEMHDQQSSRITNCMLQSG